MTGLVLLVRNHSVVHAGAWIPYTAQAVALGVGPVQPAVSAVAGTYSTSPFVGVTPVAVAVVPGKNSSCMYDVSAPEMFLPSSLLGSGALAVNECAWQLLRCCF